LSLLGVSSPSLLIYGRVGLYPLTDLAYGGFVTLCESYMGVEPHDDLWNYFCARLQ
jgi:hypothetical protein